MIPSLAIPTPVRPKRRRRCRRSIPTIVSRFQLPSPWPRKALQFTSAVERAGIAETPGKTVRQPDGFPRTPSPRRSSKAACHYAGGIRRYGWGRDWGRSSARRLQISLSADERPASRARGNGRTGYKSSTRWRELSGLAPLQWTGSRHSQFFGPINCGR